ncbi:MAG: RsmB/NOP family class I SAM-dependent RNA methyltransferase, partial [bacterium]|nr:RsmB/NOP family class I SAM-dependent RNA methyltransferase [bacterium]
LFFESFRSRGVLLKSFSESGLFPSPTLFALAFFRLKEGVIPEAEGKSSLLKIEKSLTQPEKIFLEKISEATDLELPILGPDWLVEKLENSLGESFEKESQLLSNQAPTDLRVNTLKSTRDLALQALREQDPEATITPHSPLGLRLSKRLPLTTLPLYRHGAVEIQDEGSQLLTQSIPLKSGDSILDLCAGGGGKSLAFAAALQNKGKIILTDPNSSRLKKAHPRFERAGAHCAEIIEQHFFDQRPSQTFDHVVVDVPCSGTGTIRRQPDLPWRLTEETIDSYPPLQKKILEEGVPFVKPGGTLSYMTCSLLREENEDVIQSFQKDNPSFTKVSSKKLTPKTSGTDGFFFALLQKKSS